MSNNTAFGALWKNKNKKKDNHPDHTGFVNMTEGDAKAFATELFTAMKEQREPKIQLAIWERQSKAGNPYLSIALSVDQPREENQGRHQDRHQVQDQADDFDDDIPF